MDESIIHLANETSKNGRTSVSWAKWFLLALLVKHWPQLTVQGENRDTKMDFGRMKRRTSDKNDR